MQNNIDGELATHVLYSFKELEALQKGGVQRIYTGNIATGAHQLEISLIAKLEGGRDYAQTERFTIDKGVEPKLVGWPGGGQAHRDRELVRRWRAHCTALSASV